VEELLTTTVCEQIRKNGRSPELLNCAAEIVIFGSYAAGLNTTDSDVDVLCVGRGHRLKSRSLDLSWVSEKNVSENAWLGSELAGHIAQYGIWLRGDGRWRVRVFGGEDAIDRKRKRIVSLSRTATQLWDRLHPVFQDQYNVTIRRELQRLALLQLQLRVPPTRILDNEWLKKRRYDLLELRSSIKELRPYEGQAKAPMILSLSVETPITSSHT
jgi:hypothetical protein